VRDEALVHWSSTGVRTAYGQAATAVAAWEQAIAAALAVCADADADADTDTDAAKPVLITVDAEPAQLYPAVDQNGQFNELATRTTAEQLLSQVRYDLTPPVLDQGSRP
jgi:hypothetical protein